MKKKPIFKPVGTRVILERQETPDVSEGGILIPDICKDRINIGTVLAKGPGKEEHLGEDMKEVEVGDVVVYLPDGGMEFTLEGEKYYSTYISNVLVVKTPIKETYQDYLNALQTVSRLDRPQERVETTYLVPNLETQEAIEEANTMVLDKVQSLALAEALLEEPQPCAKSVEAIKHHQTFTFPAGYEKAWIGGIVELVNVAEKEFEIKVPEDVSKYQYIEGVVGLDEGYAVEEDEKKETEFWKQVQLESAKKIFTEESINEEYSSTLGLCEGVLVDPKLSFEEAQKAAERQFKAEMDEVKRMKLESRDFSNDWVQEL